jgi:hypothetical protein
MNMKAAATINLCTSKASTLSSIGGDIGNLTGILHQQ